MKLWNILGNVNLREPVKQTEFLFQEERVKSNLIEKKFEAKFPAVPDLNTSHPALSSDNKNGQFLHKFVSELTFLDRELLVRAYFNAMRDDRIKRLEHRDKEIAMEQKFIDRRAVLKEKDEQQFRIMETWVKRFHMEKVFHQLRIKSLDEFKSLMHLFWVQGDKKAEGMRQLYQAQSGVVPSQLPPRIEWMRVTGQEEEYARLKLELVSQDIATLDQAKEQIGTQLKKDLIIQLKEKTELQHHTDNLETRYAEAANSENRVKRLA
ncbi:MAG: hypothetical protein NT027_18250 [Proteobacteria bacterium]|nr:hypothetical protein [Pseudomonadota bacterium]